MHWYAIQTHTSFESRVAERLAENVETFWPSYERKVRHTRKETLVRRSLFPGYLFAQFEDKHLIMATPHVVRVVGFGDKAVAIPDEEIATIRLMTHAPTVQPYPWASLKKGDKVRITRGPLAGVEGVVLDHKGEMRLVVSVTLLARAVSAQVDGDCLELILKAA